MYQFFVEENQKTGDKIVILGSDVNHIKNVLRMKGGERVRVSVKSDEYTQHIARNILNEAKDSNSCAVEIQTSRSYFGTIDSITEDEVIVHIQEEDEAGTELSNRIYLFQGLPKGDKMELIIQKAVELGVYEIIPVAMKNCVVKLDAKKADSKVKRWQAISESAAKQSKRTVIPEIQMPMTWKEALKKAEELDVVLVPYENERGMEATREIMQNINAGQSIGIFVGPEGGFAPEEIDTIAPVQGVESGYNIFTEENRSLENVYRISEGVHRISLGRRILRKETAGLATLSMLVFCLDE
ncbi:MAG: 16S rRNA (uracil(1498)-N(3))-methyltransferase [Agathobacter sp.]|nr:16S rRNA (uracil(1498)-N(3))-methyltransferase [Agathobacter sp.]